MESNASGNSFRPAEAHRKWRLVPLFLLLMNLGASPAFGQVRIIGFEGAKLTWTNSTAPAAYKVEYSTNLTRPWVELMTLPATNENAVTVDAPEAREQKVFYRVVWTDAPVPNPVGIWVYEADEGGSLPVRGTVTITSLEPFNSHLSFLPAAQPGSNHPVGQYTSQNGSVAGNTLRIHLSNYSFSLSGQIVGDEINGTWTRMSGGIGFPIPTPPRIIIGTFRATRAP